MEDTLRVKVQAKSIAKYLCVLILVLMEDTLRDTRFLHMIFI